MFIFYGEFFMNEEAPFKSFKKLKAAILLIVIIFGFLGILMTSITFRNQVCRHIGICLDPVHSVNLPGRI